MLKNALEFDNDTTAVLIRYTELRAEQDINADWYISLHFGKLTIGSVLQFPNAWLLTIVQLGISTKESDQQL